MTDSRVAQQCLLLMHLFSKSLGNKTRQTSRAGVSAQLVSASRSATPAIAHTAPGTHGRKSRAPRRCIASEICPRLCHTETSLAVREASYVCERRKKDEPWKAGASRQAVQGPLSRQSIPLPAARYNNWRLAQRLGSEEADLPSHSLSRNACR